jgi:glycosyltransferase involved in cell wall biosynthesis
MKYSLKKSPHIAILMCTYNGEKYLKEQLDSFEHQKYSYWTLFVSDDGSKDETLAILKSYQKRWGKDKLHILKGPRINYQTNFLKLIKNPNIKRDFYFLSDQDDIWMPHKISHTLKKLSKLNLLKPCLYCARTTYVSSDAKKILGHSAIFNKVPSFKNAIVQSIAGGNTMAFNNALRDIVNQFNRPKVASHDWWLYILNELSRGKTLYDVESTILYRQHSKSLFGANTGFEAKLKRFQMLLRGVYRQYNTTHLETLRRLKISTSKANLKLINQFYILRDTGISQRVSMIKNLGIYRQTCDTHLALYLAAILRKL